LADTARDNLFYSNKKWHLGVREDHFFVDVRWYRIPIRWWWAQGFPLLRRWGHSGTWQPIESFLQSWKTPGLHRI